MMSVSRPLRLTDESPLEWGSTAAYHPIPNGVMLLRRDHPQPLRGSRALFPSTLSAEADIQRWQKTLPLVRLGKSFQGLSTFEKELCHVAG
jgi:hypothetical protein